MVRNHQSRYVGRSKSVPEDAVVGNQFFGREPPATMGTESESKLRELSEEPTEEPSRKKTEASTERLAEEPTAEPFEEPKLNIRDNQEGLGRTGRKYGQSEGAQRRVVRELRRGHEKP
jgi:hypothetical protein